MSYPADTAATAFDGGTFVATGTLGEVLAAATRYLARSPEAQIAVFDDQSGNRLEIDMRGDVDTVLAQLLPSTLPLAPVPAGPEDLRRGPGRPRLGVVAREVTLLPRHWEWLNAQPGGASAALRRLIDEARRASDARDSQRQAQEAAYRFMVTTGGDLPGFEEALRALYTGDAVQFDAQLTAWPTDLRNYALRLAFGPR